MVVNLYLYIWIDKLECGSLDSCRTVAIAMEIFPDACMSFVSFVILPIDKTVLMQFCELWIASFYLKVTRWDRESFVKWNNKAYLKT